MTAFAMRMRRRLGDEGGHVGILMALVLFVVVGMLMMTWNTANLSKEKMRLQNAADAAALGFCTWQARGMNAVQNINDEMFVSLSIADAMLAVGTGFEIAALASEAVERVTPMPFRLIPMALTQSFHIIALLTAGMSGLLATRICPMILKPLGYFYAYGSSALGLWGAMQLAAKNRADPLGGIDLHFKGAGAHFGLFALGISIPPIDTVRLPLALAQDEAVKMPWRRTVDTSGQFRITRYSIYKNAHNFLGTGKPWSLTPWISQRGRQRGVGVTPGPSVWIATKSARHIETMPLDAWQRNFGGKLVRGLPMFAISAAQCIAGDVVPHSKKPTIGANQRGAGFGTGATAKLIPVGSLAKGVGVIIYH